MSQSDLIGQRFGRLIVIGPASRKYYWICKCDCGQLTEKIAGNLKGGSSKSCGCIRRERNNHTTHGYTGTLTHKRWRAMRARCMNPNASNYAKYGGRGITVCDRWRSFENFLTDMGECMDESMTIERKNINLGYSPDNCRWATRKEQNRNTSANHMLFYKGKSLCIGEWAELLDMNSRTIMSRLNKGWSIEKALGMPVRPTKPRIKK